MSALSSSIENFIFSKADTAFVQKMDTLVSAVKDLRNGISSGHISRKRQDVQAWRKAIEEAEADTMPHRVELQKLYLDSVINGHVFSCMERRKDMTKLKEFRMVDSEGVENKRWTEYFRDEWFDRFVGYALDSVYYGYSLITLGDIVDSKFPNLGIVPRWNISPDRLVVTKMTRSPGGTPFNKSPYKDWHVWVPTPSETGRNECGMGLLMRVGLYEIFMRNILGYNGDYVQLFGQPIRWGKTNKKNDAERQEFEEALVNMGAASWILTDLDEEIELLNDGGQSSSGSGWMSYENLELRCEKKVSKMILGHADAMDSVPGKLGAGQGDSSPIQEALRDKQNTDGKMIERIVNGQLIPKLRNLGIAIPTNLKFEYKNDAEEEIAQRKIDETNKLVAETAQIMNIAQIPMDIEHFEKRTGIKVDMSRLKELQANQQKQINESGQNGAQSS